MAHMTRQHFEFIAGVLRDHVKPGMASETYEELVATFSFHLGETNELFNERLFLDACAVDDINWDYEVTL